MKRLVDNSGNTPKIILPPEQQRQFEMVLKRGILKQLHSEKLLTDDELSRALSLIEHQNDLPT